MKVSFAAGAEDDGERIDVCVARRAQVARSQVQQALRAGDVTVNGRQVRASQRLVDGDRVEGRVPSPPQAVPQPEEIPLAVRYSDERVLVVSKPAGLVTHPAAGHPHGTLVNALLGLGTPLAGAGTPRPGIVHRLDKDTSGLLLVAKDDEAHAFLTEALKRREIKRTYLALVRGVPASASGTVDARVGRHPVRRRAMAVTPEGRPAVTHYEVVSTGRGLALLEISLETGRTHQIRVHLAYLGHPVLGDAAYGGGVEIARELGLRRPFLHASRLSFPLPAGGRVELEDPLPEDLAAALAAARLAGA